jgi:RNA polymerase sigma factor (sigma-70 family)
MAALMEAGPHQQVLRSREEVAHVRDTLADAIDGLPDDLRFVFERLIIERISMQECATLMNTSKTTVHRYKEEAIKRLQVMLQDNEEIKELLHD